MVGLQGGPVYLGALDLQVKNLKVERLTAASRSGFWCHGGATLGPIERY
jgi:hypothetical protein